MKVDYIVLLRSVLCCFELQGPLAIFPHDISAGPEQQSDLKEAARQTFLRQIQEHRRNTDDKITQLQNQIRVLQTEHNQVEDRLMRDMEQCLRYAYSHQCHMQWRIQDFPQGWGHRLRKCLS